MRRFVLRCTTLFFAMGAAGLAIGWIADGLRPAGQPSSGLDR